MFICLLFLHLGCNFLIILFLLIRDTLMKMTLTIYQKNNIYYFFAHSCDQTNVSPGPHGKSRLRSKAKIYEDIAMASGVISGDIRSRDEPRYTKMETASVSLQPLNKNNIREILTFIFISRYQRYRIFMKGMDV